MSTPINPNGQVRDPLPPEHETRRSGPGAMIWILVLLLLAVAVWYFSSQRGATPPTTEPALPIGDVTPRPSDSPVSTTPATRERVAARPATITRDARAVDSPAPDYPAAALRAGEEGTVLLRVDVDASGKPTDVAVVQSSRSRELDRAALSAARSWTFEPALRDGEAVASSVQVPIDFRMAQQ